MRNIGIKTLHTELQKEFSILFDSDEYNLVTIKDKNEIKNLDGIVIEFNSKNQLASTIDMILFIKKYQSSFIWVISQEFSEYEKKILFQLGVNGLFQKNEDMEYLFYTINNLFESINKTAIDREESFSPILNKINQTISIGMEEIQLTKIEFIIVNILVENINYTVPYDEIYLAVWKTKDGVSLSDMKYRIANIVFKIRNKLDYIGLNVKTTRGIGYKLINNS